MTDEIFKDFSIRIKMVGIILETFLFVVGI